MPVEAWSVVVCPQLPLIIICMRLHNIIIIICTLCIIIIQVLLHFDVLVCSLFACNLIVGCVP